MRLDARWSRNASTAALIEADQALLLVLKLGQVGAGGSGRALGTEDHGGTEVFGLGCVNQGNGDANAEFTFRFAAVDATRGRNVGVITANGHANVAIAAEQIIRGIEFDPTGFAEKGLDPGVSGTGRRAIVTPVLMVEVTTDLAAGNAKLPDQHDHDVGKILANALTREKSVVNRGIDAGGVGGVLEGFIDGGVQLFEESERFATALELEFVAQPLEHFGGACKLTGQKHFPIVAVVDELIEFAPATLAERSDTKAGKHVHGGLGDNLDGLMLSGNIEVMDGVTVKIAIDADIGAGKDVERGSKAALAGVATRLEANLHNAFGHGGPKPTS